jgi:hypothetical protein
MTLPEPLAAEFTEPVARYEPPRLDWSEVEVVGTAGGKSWLRTRAGDWLRVDRVRQQAEKENPWKPPSICVVRTERREVEGLSYPGGRRPSVRVETYIETTPTTEAGYRAALQADKAAAERKARKADASSVPLDALAVPFLHGYRGPAAIIERLARRGVTLGLVGGHIVPVTARGPSSDLRDILETAAPLLAAYLAGTPLLCLGSHKGAPPEAVTLAVGGAPLCEDHATGRANL